MLSNFDLGRIRQEYLKTKCVSKVVRVTGFSRNAVQAAIDRNFEVAKRQPRLSDKVLKRRRVLRLLCGKIVQKQHRRWPKYASSAHLRAALAQESGEVVSKRQIQRDLHAIGFKSFTRPSHATRSRADLSKKAAFGRLHRRANTDWRRIVFSDESWLCCNERTGKNQWCKRRDQVLPIEKKARWNVASVMVWGCIGYNWKSELVFFPSKTTVEGEARQFRLDSEAYVRRCLRTVAEKVVRENRLFQQDGARSHVSRHTMGYLQRKRVKLLEGWPPYSPELNAIERIWKELHARVGARCPMTTTELITVAKEEWAALPQELINRHCKHFGSQLRRL